MVLILNLSHRLNDSQVADKYGYDEDQRDQRQGGHQGLLAKFDSLLMLHNGNSWLSKAVEQSANSKYLTSTITNSMSLKWKRWLVGASSSPWS